MYNYYVSSYLVSLIVYKRQTSQGVHKPKHIQKKPTNYIKTCLLSLLVRRLTTERKT